MRSKLPMTLLALAGTLLLATPADAAPPRGRIAYEMLTGGIWTVGANGAGNRQVVPRANWVQWAPDGSRLLYASRYGGAGLWTARPDGSRRRLVLKAAGHPIEGHDNYLTTDPAWAPDGRRVVFTALWEEPVPDSEDGEVRSVSAVATVGVDGRGVRRVAPGHDPAWAPDGRRIALANEDSGAIALVRPDGGGARTLVAGTGSYRSALEFSPDGRRLMYLEDSTIRVADLRTRRVRTIPRSSTGKVIDATWAPDGRRIGYLRNRRTPGGRRVAPTQVWTVAPDGSGKRRLFALPYDERRGIWAQSLSWRSQP